MPRPASVHAGAASQPGPQPDATGSSPAAPAATRQNPTRSSVARGTSGWRPCHADDAVQPSEAVTSGTPAAVRDQPCVAVSISGT